MRESKAVPAGKATLSYQGKSYELPAFAGSEGPNVIDIRKLYGEADLFTYDPSFTSTASCESDITYIDGDAVKFSRRVARLKRQFFASGKKMRAIGGDLVAFADPRIDHHRQRFACAENLQPIVIGRGQLYLDITEH